VQATGESQGGVDETALEEAYHRALRLEKAGDTEGAATAYRTCLELDPDDHAGARLRLAALGLGEMHVEHEVMRLRIDGHRAARALDREAGFERLDHRLTVDRVRLLHRLGPEQDALVLRHGDLVHDLGVAEALAPRGQKLLVFRRGRFLAVVAGDQNAVAFSG